MVFAAFARRMKARGAVLVANSPIMTRSVTGELPITVREVFEGPGGHLYPILTCLSNPFTINNTVSAEDGEILAGMLDIQNNELGVYRDICNKLRFGLLYSFFREGDITRMSPTAVMYPITIEELHSGYIKGKERLITLNSGVYGWPGSSDLHFAYYFDGSGLLTQREFMTTVHGNGVRTLLNLNGNELVALKRIPISLGAAGQVNVCVSKYDREGIRLSLNGRGTVGVRIIDGDFPIVPKAGYVIGTDDSSRVEFSDGKGVLAFELDLKGFTSVLLTNSL